MNKIKLIKEILKKQKLLKQPFNHNKNLQLDKHFRWLKIQLIINYKADKLENKN